MKFRIENEKNSQAQVKIALISQKDSVSVYEIIIENARENSPVTVTWTECMEDIYSTWQPLADRKRWIPQWFRKYSVDAQFYCGTPVFVTVRQNGNNNTAIALLDTIGRSQIGFGVNDIEEKDEVLYTLRLWCDGANDGVYRTQLRIDKRNVPFMQAVKDVSVWYQKQLKIERYVPNDAEEPLYSSWYNFHQQPKEGLLLEELAQAKEMGFKTVIIDDGWQFAGSGNGNYVNCGDWSVSQDKFSDFKGFIEKIHEFGMKAMLWFPVPFVGFNTRDYQKYKDKLLYNDEEQKAGVLDVRYREIREYIVGIYKRFVKEYDLDGLKLDFIDSFTLKDESPAYNGNMDCKTVTGGVLRLLQTVNDTFIKNNSEFLIEFRQNYVGAEIIRYCNMLRVGDCAYDSVTNRIAIADLRAIHTDVAIHSDMLLWSPKEKVEQCAKQLLNVMFSVPQISVLLTKIPKEQKELVANFVKYWKENKRVLLHGELKVERPEANYSLTSSETEDKKITVLYADNFYSYTGKTEDVFNGTDKDKICIGNDNEEELYVEIFDVFGKKINSKKSNGETVKVSVPVCGMVRVKGDRR